jgi:selenocysteine-specific elongation factor
MAHTVVGTAGHIDHGKTLLVKALTGTDTDRAPEERARGITIELGFAFLGEQITIIDVPGHERFVKTMVAGVSTIDVALLVIAADDGIMPQSREHLDVLQLLGIERGIIALNKVDMVDEEWLELVEDEVRDFVQDTFLQEADIHRVSAQSGEGIDGLRANIEKMATATPARQVDPPFRLPVDRAFVVKGFGLVCTGTLIAGELNEGEVVEVLPAGENARVRNLQMHGRSVERVGAGDRAAVNLSGIDHEKVQRGDVLMAAGLFKATSMLDVRLRLLPSCVVELEQRARVRLHMGTAEVLARVVLLDCDILLPGGEALAQLRLETPLCAAWGDRFVMRRYSPALSIGGGTVLDPRPLKHRRADEDTCVRLRALENDDPMAVVEAFLLGAGDRMVAQSELVGKLAFSVGRVGELLAHLERDGRIVQVGAEGGRSLLHVHVRQMWEGRIQAALAAYHAEFPLRVGLRREELRQRSARYAQTELFDQVLVHMESAGGIVITAATVRAYGHEIEFDEVEEALRQRVGEAVRTRDWPALKDAAGLARELAVQPKELEPVLGAMQSLGSVVVLEGGLLLHADIAAEVRASLVDYLGEKKQITVAEYRELINGNRKCALALLAHFDGERLTERQGDFRVLVNKK